MDFVLDRDQAFLTEIHTNIFEQHEVAVYISHRYLLVSLRKSDVLQAIWDTVPVGSPEPTDAAVLDRLGALTQELIDISGRERLLVDPFIEVYDRQVQVDDVAIANILKDKIVLVTGGRGFVGTNLIAKLQQLGVKKIVAVDVTGDQNQLVAIENATSDNNIPVDHYQCDVRDAEALQDIFAKEQPHVVFHLAAQRLPGLAETQIHQTVSTNLFGCINVIDCCEKYRVAGCVFSSTGKASRYFTPDIYAGSKKIAEWLFSEKSKSSYCQFGIVRFTHVVENSPISAELDLRVAAGLVSLHAPDRHIYAQNIEESVNLLLKSLTNLQSGTTEILSVRDIGWPVNTLDVALHKILKSGKNIPLYFKGIPAGYERHVFMGQLDLSGQREVLPMLNVLEGVDSRVEVASNTVTAPIIPFDAAVLAKSVAQIQQASLTNDTDTRQAVIQGVKDIALSSFRCADPHLLLDILNWGTNICELDAAGVDITYHQETIELLVAGIGLRDTVENTFKLPFSHLSEQIASKNDSLLLVSKLESIRQPVKVLNSLTSPVAV
jgi:NADP-dependent 3-hydroxy acid dehydrogenase YdfG